MTDLEIALYFMSLEEREMLLRYVLLYLQRFREKEVEKSTTHKRNDNESHSQHIS